VGGDYTRAEAPPLHYSMHARALSLPTENSSSPLHTFSNKMYVYANYLSPKLSHAHPQNLWHVMKLTLRHDFPLTKIQKLARIFNQTYFTSVSIFYHIAGETKSLFRLAEKNCSFLG
jgi:protein gp37